MSGPRRFWSRSPNHSIIVDAGEVKVRVGRRAQLAIVRALAPLAVKLVIAGVVALAAVLAWEC